MVHFLLETKCALECLTIKVIAPSTWPVSIDLHVKCPFYKKWNKKKPTIIYLVKFSHGIWRTNIYILTNLLVREQYFFSMSATLQRWSHYVNFVYTLQAGFGAISAPTVDGYFIKDHPKTLVENGNFQKLRIMLGTNADEFAFSLLFLYPNSDYADGSVPPTISKYYFDIVSVCNIKH